MYNKFLPLMFFLAIAVGAQTAVRQERQPLTRPDPERTAKAQELLSQARAALSSAANFETLQTLSVSAKIRRAAMTASAGGAGTAVIIGGDMDPTIFGADNYKEHLVSGKVEYDFALPDKFRWEEAVERHHRSGFLDGDRLWQKINNRVPSPSPQMLPMMRQIMQTQLVYIPLGFVLTPPPGFAVEYSYSGTKTLPDAVAEVITITGPGTFKADLYLDQTTHLPFRLRFVIGGIGHPAMVFMPGGTPRQEGMRALEAARQQAEAKPPGPQEREKLILFTDYRAVDGLLFPHKITTQIHGKLIEEITVTKMKVNHPLTAEKFTEKK